MSDLSIRPLEFVARDRERRSPAWMQASPRAAAEPLDLRAPAAPRTAPRVGLATHPTGSAVAPGGAHVAGSAAAGCAHGPELQRAIEDLIRARARLATDAERDLTALAVAIAEAIVERELTSDPELHRRFVAAALEALTSTDEARIRVSPRVFELLAGPKVDFEVVLDGVPLVEDPSIESAGCVVETPRARVDARISERLAAVARALDEATHGADGAQGDE